MGRLELGERIVLSGQGRAQAGDVELSRHQIALQMPELGTAHGRVELDEDVAGLDALTVADMDRAHHAGLERLDDLGAAARNDLARRDGDNVDRADTRPGQRSAEHGDDGERNGAADRRGRRFDDLERRRQKGEFVLSTLYAPLRKGDECLLADLMEPCLEPMESCIAAAGLDQLVVGAVLDQAAAVDGDDAVGHPHRGEPMRDDEHRSAARDLRHVLLNDALALVVERACRLVENQDARIGNQRAGDGDALPLAARTGCCRAHRRSCHSPRAVRG